MMSVPCGRRLPEPFATYDPDSSCLKMCQGSLSLGNLPESSLTLPDAGSMRSGSLFRRPPWAPAMDGSACSSLPPTPTARDGAGRGHPGPNYIARTGRPLDETIHTLLPTPKASDGAKGGPNQRGSSGDLALPSAVMALLPTPQARDGDESGRSMSTSTAQRRFDQGKRNLDDAIALLEFPGDATSPPSDVMSELSGDQLPLLLLPEPEALGS